MSEMLMRDIIWTSESILRNRQNGCRELCKSEWGYLSSLLSRLPDGHRREAVNVINGVLGKEARV